MEGKQLNLPHLLFVAELSYKEGIEMILEYRDGGIDNFVWHMVESDHIATSCFYVEEDMKKLSEKSGNDLFDNLHNIRNIAKKKMNEAGYCSCFHTFLHVGNKEKTTDIKEIVMIALDRSRGTEVHFFDSDYPYRTCYKDGTIVQESAHFIN